jgi:2-methylisocitrate lyase-like PEP mutase family enzyme
MDAEGSMIDRFRALHAAGIFVMPNPWDVGSARVLEGLGFEELATTSGGQAQALGRLDGGVQRHELIGHVADLTAVIGVPLNVDAERCFAETPEGVAATVEELTGAGAAGISIEDWNPEKAEIDPIAKSVDRVAAAVEAAAGQALITARSENHIRGVNDIDNTVARLQAYREAGADVLYAPGIYLPEDIRRVTDLGLPVNYLALPSGPTVAELGELGVRRVSTGSSLARASFAALIDGAKELMSDGTSEYIGRASSASELQRLLR